MQQPVKDDALCAAMNLCSVVGMREVTDAPAKPRGHTIPRIDWWCEAATAAAAEFSHVELARVLLERFRYEVSSTSVGRTLNGDVLTIETALLLSDLFGLPPPVIMPASQDEALALLGRQQREQIRAQLGVIRAGVAKKRADGQAIPLRSIHAKPGAKRR